ncbi:hypothetical protein CRG98_039147 [Punica granatum]|uniref:Uncharacterized protein n=1 Tax=Punica granatum TaxID=22663 RepID=A0A2I0I908_PUNGR|nr:hypothetical protein CRG98_039147 [Punica granatum]
MHVRGARCTGRAAGVHGRRAGARVGAGVQAGARGCVRGAGAGARAGARLAHVWHCSPESDDSSPEMH